MKILKLFLNSCVFQFGFTFLHAAYDWHEKNYKYTHVKFEKINRNWGEKNEKSVEINWSANIRRKISRLFHDKTFRMRKDEHRSADFEFPHESTIKICIHNVQNTFQFITSTTRRINPLTRKPPVYTFHLWNVNDF